MPPAREAQAVSLQKRLDLFGREGYESVLPRQRGKSLDGREGQIESVLLYLPARGDFDMCRRYQMPDNVEPFQPDHGSRHSAWRPGAVKVGVSTPHLVTLRDLLAAPFWSGRHGRRRGASHG